MQFKQFQLKQAQRCMKTPDKYFDGCEKQD